MTHQRPYQPNLFLSALLAIITLLTACSPQVAARPVISPPIADQNTEAATIALSISNLDETDTELFQRTAQLFALFREKSDQIWNERYRLDQMALLYVRTDGETDQYAYLINHPQAAEIDGAEAVDLPTDLHLGPVYRFNTIPDAAQITEIQNYDFNHNLAGTQTYIMKYTTADVDSFAAPVSHEWALYVAHEGLHDNQLDNWQEAPSNYQDLAGYPLNADHLALIMLEDAVLEAALQAEDAATQEQALKQFIAIRQTRINQWDEVRLLDLPQEQMEGNASYIEHRLGTLLGSAQSNLDTFAEMLETVPTSNIRDTVAFGRFYGTGAAQSHLLDQRGIDWKPQIEQGKSQFDVLAAQYNLSDNEISALLADAKTTHNFEAMVPIAEKAAATAASEPADIFAEELDEELSGDISDGETIVSVEGPFPEKPFETAPDNLTFTHPPAGYALQGGYTVSFDEIQSEMRPYYSPQGSDLQVVVWMGAGYLQVIRAQHNFNSLDEADFGQSQIKVVAGQDVLFENFSDEQGAFTIATFLRNDEFITIEGTIPEAEMRALVADLLNK